MKLSSLSFRTKKQAPADADTINHQLLVQGGFVSQLMAGVYTYLPLGLRVLRKINRIVREEMDGIGGQEIFMPALHPAENWKQTGGWDSIDVLFKVESRTEREYALGQSHEEIVTPLVKEFIQSYKDLPLSVYQIQWKYRDELRSKSGILRGREFQMKDMYSFHENQEDFAAFYETVKQAYLRVFKRLGLTAKATEASGGNFTDKISYEFMVLTDAGEDDIIYCPVCEFCVNTEIATVEAGTTCEKCGEGELAKDRAAEVGNVFDLGRKYAQDFDVWYTDADGERKQPIMGCYGIGTTRTMGVIVEDAHDENGIIWPAAVAPFAVHLISLRGGEDRAAAVYEQLQQAGIEVLWDDRDESPGVKFAVADLVGNPVRLVVSAKTGDQVEWKARTSDDNELISLETAIERLSNIV